MRTALLLLLLLPSVFTIDVDYYYGHGCPHCAATSETFNRLQAEYDLRITEYEVYYDADARSALLSEYERFGYNPLGGGVPTTVIGDTMILGGMSEGQWRALFDACEQDGCPAGIHSASTFQANGAQPPMVDPIHERDETSILTLPVLIGAAIVDSVNPCTIAVMILLIGAVLYSKGKRSALISGLIFTAVIFIMYLLYGFGILRAITALELTNLFYILVTIGALILAVMEFNAYFNYKPGFLAVEMPMWLRPHAKKVTSEATSPFGVAVAAIFCSLFLLPCSSGPYLLVLGMLAKTATLQTVSYLLLYNFFFVLPMLLITVAIHVGKTSVEQVGEMKDRFVREIHLFSGIILLVLFLLMLNQVLGII